MTKYQWSLWMSQWKLKMSFITQLLYSLSRILLNMQRRWGGWSVYNWHLNHDMCKEKPCRQNLLTQKCHVWIISIKGWLLPYSMGDGKYPMNNYQVVLIMLWIHSGGWRFKGIQWSQSSVHCGLNFYYQRNRSTVSHYSLGLNLKVKTVLQDIIPPRSWSNVLFKIKVYKYNVISQLHNTHIRKARH